MHVIQVIAPNPGLAVARLGLGCLLVAGLGACSGSGTGSGGEGAETSCAATVLTVVPTTMPAGGSIRVLGKYYVQECADVVEQGSSPPATGPMAQVPLTLSTGPGVDQELARLDAHGALGQIDSSVTIPANLHTGTVTIRLGDAEPVRLSIT